MDSLTQIRLSRDLIDIDSTTGREGEAGACLARLLRDLGWTVTEQPVSEGRFNVIASVGDPLVVFSTHFDCVPPFFASRVENGRLHGRGACDAKGILMARHSITAAAAFDLLRQHSQEHGRKVIDIADAIVESHLLLLGPATPPRRDPSD